MKAKIVLLGMMLSTHAFAQTTKHGIASAWYQSPKAAASITGAVSLTNYVRGSVANSMVVKSNGTVVIFYRHNGQNKWVQSSDNGNTWTSLGALPASAATGLSSITADIDPNNNIYIAWKSGEFSLGFSKFNGTSWSSPIPSMPKPKLPLILSLFLKSVRIGKAGFILCGSKATTKTITQGLNLPAGMPALLMGEILFQVLCYFPKAIPTTPLFQ